MTRTRTASLPMYAFPESKDATRGFWSAIEHGLSEAGRDIGSIVFDDVRPAVPDGIGPDVFFTQICGYPLFKRFRQQGRMLATPRYSFKGCEGSRHCGVFMARADDSATRLEDFRGKVFGCNSLLSNSGMNLPRLSLARIADGKPFFASVTMTHGHLRSLDALKVGTIDLCSIDNVTWGLFEKFRPQKARAFRVLAETISSPCLPFVTSAATSPDEAAALKDALFKTMGNPATSETRQMLGLTGLDEPDIDAYERLADIEDEAARLGYPDIV